MGNLIVKVRDINNLTDARYFAAWNVKYLTFNLNTDFEDAIPVEKAKEIIGWVQGPKNIGSFSIHQSLNYIESCRDLLGLDLVELIGTTSDFVGLPYEADFYQIVVQEDDDIESIQKTIYSFPTTSIVVLNFSENKIQNYEEYIKLSTEMLILDAPFVTSKLIELIKSNTVVSVQLAGGEEEKVGYKSFDELDELFEAVEEFIYF